MIIAPTYPYCGLTVVLSNPSRFDNDKQTLLSAGGGWFFSNECLAPLGLSKGECDIRTVEERDLRPNTKALLLLGERALHEWGTGYTEYTLNEQRGYLLDNYFDLPCIASYLPQNCVDIVDHEARLNPLLIEDQDDEDEEGEEDDAIGEKSRHGKTRRSNWGFWLRKDTEKLVRIFQKGIPTEPKPKYTIYPSSAQAISVLQDTKDSSIYFDIETNVPGLNITVMSIGLPNYEIYTIPILRFDYSNAYNNLNIARIFRSLAVAFRDNEVVIHNSLFDLFVTSYMYSIPTGKRIYDTMLAFHRCFPEQEKSLGHVMSWGTYQRYHKDEGNFNPHNQEQERKLWEYNAKDVYGLMLCRRAIDDYAASKGRGLQDSIREGNRRTRHYLLNTLMGIRYDDEKRQKIIKENDRICNFLYNRMIPLLCGTQILPTSNKQCVKWFHEIMGYKKIKNTSTGNPSLDGDAMYKLLLKNPENVSIKFFLKYRERIKETGSLKFNPWRSLQQTNPLLQS